MLEVELLVIDTETIEDRRIEIADVNGVFRYVVTEVISFAVDGSSFDACAGHPHCVATWVMISSVVRFGERALAIDRTAEFAAPDD